MPRFEGLWPVMLTAFQEDGGLDLAGVDALVDFYLEGGSHGLFAVCQSSEKFFLDDDVVHVFTQKQQFHHADIFPRNIVKFRNLLRNIGTA